LASTLGAQRFLREIKIVAKLTHPHIVPLYDSGLVDGYLYYVMPYIEGESLRERIEREKQLPLDEALEIARDVADALGRAHEIGIVHRDVKPENILVSGGHALVADFGIARAVTVATGSKLTRSGMVVGTPSYISPEQGAGSREVDGRSDVYSLGCVLYEMLGGEPPFTGPTPESIARQHVSIEPRSITDLRPAVPKSVAAAISRALAKTPADRFSQVTQFAEALAPSAVRRAAHRSSRRRRLTLLAATSVLLLVIAAIVGRLSLAPELDANRVVVVPLENRTGDTALALLGSMAADWITQGLQGIDVIEVVPTATGVDPGPDLTGLFGSSGPSTARAVGEATGAGTVVAGAYYRRGDSLEFQTQVIDAAGERLLRAPTPVTGMVGTTGAIMDTLRRRVVATVAAALDYRLLQSSAASPPPSLDAYRAYLQGHRAFQQVPLRMEEALQLFYQAVALDSTFSDPRFFIVMAHLNLGEFHEADSNAQLLIPFRSRFSPYQQAFLDWLLAALRGDRSGALQAVRLRGALPDVAVEALKSNRAYESIEILRGVGDLSAHYFHWMTLMEALHMTGDYRRELSEARRARAIHPEAMRMLLNEVRALAALGRLDEIDRRLDESLLLPSEDGLGAPWLMGSVAAELRAHGHREASLGAAGRAVDWFASRPHDEAETSSHRAGLALTLYVAEQWNEARSLFEELAAVTPHDVNFQGYLGVLAARRGDREEALRISDRLEGMADRYEFGRDLYWQACIAAQLGERERAMVLLREAHARGRPFLVLLHADMDLEPLHDYPPFQDFIRPKG
jgi:tetratricopeptide (TPR) repeat protein